MKLKMQCENPPVKAFERKCKKHLAFILQVTRDLLSRINFYKVCVKVEGKHIVITVTQQIPALCLLLGIYYAACIDKSSEY